MIDAWSDPSNPPNPQQFPRSYGPNDGITKLLDKIKAIETQLRDVRSHLPGSGGIGNDALTSPSVPQAVYTNVRGFALTVAGDLVISYTVTVPAGFTTAIVSATALVYAVNPRTVADSFAGLMNIDSFVSDATIVLAPASGGYNTAIAPFVAILSGLTPGGTFIISIYAATVGANWALNANNKATLSGLILWQR